MKRNIKIVFPLMLSAIILAGCGTDYNTENSTVFASKDGSVVSTDVEKFDTGTYDKDDFEQYVKGEIDNYNDSNDGSVKLKELEVKDGQAHLTISYDSSKEYTSFNGTEMFCGTIAEALAAGYDFNKEFAAIDDGKAESCDKSDFLDSEGYKVVIYKGTSNVHVESNILYASVDNTKIVDDKTIAVGRDYNLLKSENENTENTQSTEKISETSQTEQAESGQSSDGSVSEDDILNAVTEKQEVTFDFDKDDDEEIAASYITYIIYK